ncbi:hypothetical protein [Pseudomonas sp. R5(2019)]|uniref:hypothetical protein n=1 Tax=Pseudomonas sp. R5(2019) TaxID=2697566 RepID=UPI0014134323|nr:hypothetical protein [Pseudomonas sp. R5(2019)]NBA93569.1 hypothetical protein [Pseudomonas sp. R5(2019)]
MFFGLSRVINRLLADQAMEELNAINLALTRRLAECELELDRISGLMAIEVSLCERAESDLQQVHQLPRFGIEPDYINALGT